MAFDRINGYRVFIQDNVRAFLRDKKVTVRRGSTEFKEKNDSRPTNKGNIFHVTHTNAAWQVQLGRYASDHRFVRCSNMLKQTLTIHINLLCQTAAQQDARKILPLST